MLWIGAAASTFFVVAATATKIRRTTSPGRGAYVQAEEARAAPPVQRSFTRATLAEMRERARSAPRGRFGQLLHREFHQRRGLTGQALDDAASADVQRFLNVFAKGSYVMPHVHPEKGKWEVFVHVDGDFNVLALDSSAAADDASNALETARLSAEVPLIFVHEGCWHSLAALDEGGAVEFEFKPGPYGGVSKDKIFSHQLEKPWAYDEGDVKAQAKLPEYVRHAEGAVGKRASLPGSPESNYSLLRPFTRTALLEMLGRTEPEELRLVDTGPGEVKPLASVIPVKAGTASASAGGAHRVHHGRWVVYAWLAGDEVQVGSLGAVGPDAPLLEVDLGAGGTGALALRGNLTSAGPTGGVVLELCSSP